MFETTIKNDMEQIWKYHKAAFFLALGITFFFGLILGGMLCGSKKAPASAPVKTGSGSGKTPTKSRKED